MLLVSTVTISVHVALFIYVHVRLSSAQKLDFLLGILAGSPAW